MQKIYLDNAATTATDPRVIEAMLPYFTEKYGNPESPHSKGKEALIAVDEARETIAGILNCRPSEIFFFGSATEVNNTIIKSSINIVTSEIEHASILEPAKEQGRHGIFIKVDKEGFLDLEELEKSLNDDTGIVSVIYANNEIGTVQDIKKIAAICDKKGIPLHIDACQAAGSLTLDVEELNIDFMTLNGSKIYGPKGIGVLYKRSDMKLSPLMLGGGQEKSLRPGTHNVPAIIGFAKALEIANQEPYKTADIRDEFIADILKGVPDAKLNGSADKRLPNNINLTIPGVEATELVFHLDTAGTYISTGSACSTGKNEPSHILKAIGLSDKDIYSSIRISLARNTSEAELKIVSEKLVNTVTKLRK